MSRSTEYIIPFGSCSNGVHTFDYELTDEFFASFPDSGFGEARVHIRVSLFKQERQLQFDVHLEGWVVLPCDRCLEEYEQSVGGDYTLYGKFGEGNSDEELDIIWLRPEEHQVDLSHYFYEYVVLNLPMRKVHPGKPDGRPGCNPAMLDLLKNLSV